MRTLKLSHVDKQAQPPLHHPLTAANFCRCRSPRPQGSNRHLPLLQHHCKTCSVACTPRLPRGPPLQGCRKLLTASVRPLTTVWQAAAPLQIPAMCQWRWLLTMQLLHPLAQRSRAGSRRKRPQIQVCHFVNPAAAAAASQHANRAVICSTQALLYAAT